ncbi:lytic transglycosylase domain-containing protein [Photobacterium frigidiphilum]|uniref:lytic transglycosylase domain-containing protein n=1 Tax=Photobacterium frigidiphilum TaxID=264736 RepID=UPI003D1257C0
MFDIAPLEHCINQVHPAMVQKIIAVESANNPIAINVNILKGKPKPRYTPPKTKAAAIRLANDYIKQGHSVDLGLMQVNSNNLTHYGVTVNDMFNPCKNINVGSTILYEAYQRALRTKKEPQIALRHALSIYNTGNMTYGFKNGYVNRYTPYESPKTAPASLYTNETTIPLGNLYD